MSYMGGSISSWLWRGTFWSWLGLSEGAAAAAASAVPSLSQDVYLASSCSASRENLSASGCRKTSSESVLQEVHQDGFLDKGQSFSVLTLKRQQVSFCA